MDAILLCAGKGTRLRPLTDRIPKPLVPLAGSSPLERSLHILPARIDRVILVVGHLGHVIQERIGSYSQGRDVVYVEQKPLNGTGGALRQARMHIRSELFLVMNGDDLYDQEDLRKLAADGPALLTLERALDRMIDSWKIGDDGSLQNLIPSVPGASARINIGAYVLDRRWFGTSPVRVPGKTDEWSLPHAIPQLIADGVRIRAQQASFWMPVGTPEELASAEAVLAKSLEAKAG